MMLIILIFSRFFHCNVIIECYILVLVFSLYPPLLAVLSAIVAFLTIGAHVIVYMLCFLCFLVVMCFLNKLMMMMFLVNFCTTGPIPRTIIGSLFAASGLGDEKPHERNVDFVDGFTGRRPSERQNENP